MTVVTALARLFTNFFPSAAERERQSTLTVLERRLKRAERSLREAYDEASALTAEWERERDEIMAGRGLAGQRGSRKDGDSWPFLRTMQDLINYRTMSREACEGNGYGAGMLDRAIDFVVGDGMQFTVTLRGSSKGAVSTGVVDADGDGRPDADPRVQAVQSVIDEFRRLNDWGCGEEDREEEGFRRSQRDGEVFVRFFDGPSNSNGIPLVRWIEPEQVDTPPDGAEWRWGIEYSKTDGRPDVENKKAIYAYDMDGTDGEWVPFSEVVFHKLGTDRTVLRGMPQFWLVALALSQCDKLNSAVAEVSAIQAQIAYVREHAPGIMPGQITNFVGGTGDVTAKKPTPYGDKYRRVGYGENGTVVDMSAGMKFNAGPVSTGVPGFVSALQSRLRQVCARFGYPEFFTGDACLSEDSQMLTRRGWVGVHDLRADDEIGTANPDTHALEYQRPEKVWQTHRAGPMVHLKTSRFDLLVTPNHDLYTTRLQPAKPNWHKVRADELAASPPVTFGCLSSVDWKGGRSPETIHIPGIGDVPTDDAMEFLGVYVGDGSVAANGVRVAIAGVTRPRKVKMYTDLFCRLGFKHSIGGDGRHQWYKDSRELNEWLTNNVGTECKNKRLPSFVFDLAAGPLLSLWQGLLESDGYKPEGRSSMCYSTVSESLADDVQIVCLKIGYTASVTRNKPGSLGTLDVFKVNVKPAGVATLRANNVSAVEGYEGVVWCVTVPNGLIVSRRNGKVSVSGNSNNNYASSLTAGGPAERAFKRKQLKYAAFQAAVYRKACEYAVKSGRLGAADLAAVEIKVQPGGVSIANKLEEAQVQQIRIQNKLLSPQTAMVENGHDPRMELANIKAFDDQFGGGAMGLGGGGMGGQEDDPFGGGFAPTGEGYTQDEYDVLSEADRSGLVRKELGKDKRGRRIVRWVKPDQDGGGLSRGKVDNIRSALDAAVKDPTSLTPESVALIEKHAGELTGEERRKYAKALRGAGQKPQPQKTAADVAPPKVSPDEAKAFYDYSEDVGYDLNSTLRGGDTPTGREKEVFDAVNKVIEGQGTIKPPVTVYRALSWSHPEDKAAFLNGVKAGGDVTLSGLQSTSLDRGFVEGAFGERRGGAVVMEIVAKKGVRMAGDMTAHESQKEILLPHGGRFRVVGIEDQGGKTVLKMEQL